MEYLKPKTVEDQGPIAASLRVVQCLKFILTFLIITEVVLTCSNIIGSFDFPWQFAEGQFILSHGYPAKSVFQAYGEISPQYQNEYIFYEVLIAVINRFLGWWGLCIFFCFICLLIYLPCLVAFFKSKCRFVLIDVCLFILGQFLINMKLSARPELIADFCYVFVGIMLTSWPARSWSLRQAVMFGFIFFLWGNAHGTFLLGLAMLGLWYGQLLFFEWKSLLSSKTFGWTMPGLAAFAGCIANPFGIYRIIQPFQLHSLIWGQGTSLEMGPVPLVVLLLPLTWTAAAILVLALRANERKYYWMIAMLVLLQYLTFFSIRYNIFIGLTLLIVTWDGLRHPRKIFSPPILGLPFALARVGVYLILVAVFGNMVYSLFNSKTDMLRGYMKYVYPKADIVASSSFNWMKDHPDKTYSLLSFLAAGSWSQMPGTTGIHPFIDSGTHRFSDRTNQLYYYSFSSPQTFRLIASKLNINSIAVNSGDIYWAYPLNVDPNWKLVQIESDSQLYLRKSDQSANASATLFSDWEKGQQSELASPIGYSSVWIIRGLGLRADAESLKMLALTSDVTWIQDPQYVYVKDWIDHVSDNLVEETLKNLGDNNANSSLGFHIVLLLRLHRDAEAAEIARKWHPTILDVGYQDFQMLRVEAFLRQGDLQTSRQILEFVWPKPRFSLRWARLCQQVYRTDPQSMPTNARLLTSIVDDFSWQEDLIAVLNQNISRLSTKTPLTSPSYH